MKCIIALLLLLVASSYAELRTLYDYQGNITFDQKMFEECMNTTHISIRPPFHQPGTIAISCVAKWTPYIDLQVKLPKKVTTFNTGCYGLEGTINWGYISFYSWKYCDRCRFTKEQLEECLQKKVGTVHSFNFVGVLPPSKDKGV